MKNLDTLYEAYINYKKLCVVDNDTDRFMRAYMAIKDRESENVTTIFSVCHIEQDWVEAIEVGLPFIEKAIKEERQFIRNDGEVLPIEKIRKTSKDSIQDLAKHANYITHEAPDDLETEVLPDKMLMIQKESDFAIYENRVLYAALMYLKDFVASRLVEIKETTNTYLVKQHIKKMIDMGSRKIRINLEFDESRVNDPLLTDKNNEKDVIDRLDEILTGILALLKTPLMREVSKAEMVSRPIAKTNILKMNRNFRESLACFEYIANYQGKGFTIEHIEKSLIPYSKAMNESYTEMLIMLSFINYMYANNISQDLRNDLDAILAEREKQKNNELLARLRNFHATAETKEQTMNEFLIAFEQGYRILEARNDELEIEHKEQEVIRAKEIRELQEKHEAFVDDLKEAHEDELNRIKREIANKVNEAERDFDQRLVEFKNQKDDEVRQEKENTALQLEEFKEQFKDHIKQMEQENAAIKAQEAERIQKIASLEAQLLNNSIKNGDTKEIDFTSEEAFDQLEELKKNFDAFYERAWKEAKKQIRRDVLFARRNKKKKDEEPEPEVTPVRSAPQPEFEPEPEPELGMFKKEPVKKEAIKEEPVVEEPVVEEPVPEEVSFENTPYEEEILLEETPFEEEIQSEETPLEDEQIAEEPVEEELQQEDTPAEEPLEEEPQVEENPKESSIEDNQVEENVEEHQQEDQPLEEDNPFEEEEIVEEEPKEEIKEDAIE